jgi:hypothetical protein
VKFLLLSVQLDRRPAFEHHVHLVRRGVGVGRLGLAWTESVHVEEEPLGGEEVVLLELGLEKPRTSGRC